MLEYCIILLLALVALALIVDRFAPVRRDKASLTARHMDDAQTIRALRADIEQLGRGAVQERQRSSEAMANLSHELRTPLNGILGFAELLLAGDIEDHHRKHAQLISESGRGMLRLLNDLVDMARIDAGQLRLVEEQADLRRELQHCVETMAPAARKQGVTLSCKTGPQLPRTTQLDRMQLREILFNLVGNAIKFARDGAVVLEALTGEAQGVETLEIRVSDNGIGIAPEKHDAIFEPFADIAVGQPASAQGSGRGLAIARKLARRMGGDITLVSTPGNGSVFTVRLPLVEPGGDMQTVPTIPVSCGAPAADIRVLVAEDNAINQQLILAMLAQLGITPNVVSDGQQAISTVEDAIRQGKPFDVVLMDVRMPQMDGLEAARRLRQSGLDASDLAILALTANCYNEDIDACLAAGMQGHIAKPFQMADIADALAPYRAENNPVAIPASDPQTAAGDAAKLDLRRQPGALSGTIGGLEAKFAARKRALFNLMSQLLAENAEHAQWDNLARELHKIAGTAANFGQAELGYVSRQLEQQIRAAAHSEDRHILLSRAYPRLQEAA